MKSRALLKTSFWTLASLLLFSCSKIILKKEKKPENFSIYLPLAEDYSILNNSLHSVIKAKYPKAKIQLRDYLSSSYTMAPFDEWIMKANDHGLLQLVIHVPELEERDSLVAFLRQNTSRLLFRHKIPSFFYPNREVRILRGEGYFCRMTKDSKDLLEQQLCGYVLSSFCSPASRKGVLESFRSAPSCSLRFSLPLKDGEEEKISPKDIVLSTFPLPLKVKNDYPFERFTEIDESVIMALFKE